MITELSPGLPHAFPVLQYEHRGRGSLDRTEQPYLQDNANFIRRQPRQLARGERLQWCFYGWKLGAAHHFYGPNNATDLWSIKKVNPQSMVHLTEKPVQLAVRAMQYSSRSGENVLDLFGGSGSTLIAAEQTGRRSFLMELDPLYCDVIVRRWEQFTGKKAERLDEAAC